MVHLYTMNKISVFNYTVNNQTDKSCDVFIDGRIVDAETQQMYELYFGETALVSFKSIRNQIDQYVSDGCKTVNVKVNSQGGSAVEAFAINDYLTELESKGVTVNRIGLGFVASAATLIVSGNGSSISPNSWFMVHNASGAIRGNVNEIEQYAATVRKFNNQILNHYISITGLSKTVLQNMMDNETFLSGKDAVDMGFVAKLSNESANVTNQYKPENWIFNSARGLQVYNSFTPQNSNQMDIKTIINGVQSAFIDALKEAGIIKDDQTKLADQLTNALDKALEPMNQGINDAVNDAVTAKLADLNTTVSNAVNEAIKNLTFATKDDIANAIKPVNDELEAVKNDVANGAGSADPNPAASGAVHNALTHPGISW